MYGSDWIYLALMLAWLLLIVTVGGLIVVGIYRFVAWAMKTVAAAQSQKRIPRAIVANQR